MMSADQIWPAIIVVIVCVIYFPLESCKILPGISFSFVSRDGIRESEGTNGTEPTHGSIRYEPLILIGKVKCKIREPSAKETNYTWSYIDLAV